jgi:hypothetical protein
VLRDWLPFALGAAITAGVAPLLFVQVLYKHSFYTANLLLLHRWMAIVPILMVGFYLLYLAKTDRAAAWSARARGAVGLIAFGCFAFTAYSWTENHLLSSDPSVWADHYAEGRMLYTSGALWPRFALWLAGAIPVMAAALGWQLRAAERAGDATRADGDDDAPVESAAPSVALVALAGLLVAAIAAAVFAATLSVDQRGALTGALAGPWLLVAAVGALVQAGAWARMWLAGQWTRRALLAATAGAAASIVGLATTREALRLHGLGVQDEATLADWCARAADSGGFAVFAVVTLGAAGVIAWCVGLVRHGLKGRN